MEKTPDHAVEPSAKHILELIQYNEANYERFGNLKIDTLLGRLQHDNINWINLDGLGDRGIIKKLAKHFNLHLLLVEDICSEVQPKAEEFEEYLFVTAKMLYRSGKTSAYEQLSFVLGHHYLITFQEKEGDPFDAFRERIQKGLGQVRKKKADYLLYRLIDIIVDNYYEVLEGIGEQIEDLEDEVYGDPRPEQFQKIQAIKKELIFLRKVLHPLRDTLAKLSRGESDYIREENIRYFSDVHSHIVQLINTLDTYRDLATTLVDVYMNSLNIRMTEVMKVLAIFSTIFMPLTFIVGVYGMNFDIMPELRQPWGYPAVMGVMGAISIGLIAYFKYKKWM